MIVGTWYVQLTAIWNWYLPLYIYITFYFILYLMHCFNCNKFGHMSQHCKVISIANYVLRLLIILIDTLAR